METTVEAPTTTACVPWVDPNIGIDGVPVSTLEAELALLMEKANPVNTLIWGECRGTNNMS
eukprot:4865295-Amphidinium_carterae.5